MREFIGITAAWSSAIVGVCGVMQVMGIGHPNCDPTPSGYAVFYATLFASSVASCLLAWLGLGVIIGVRNFMRA